MFFWGMQIYYVMVLNGTTIDMETIFMVIALIKIK